MFGYYAIKLREGRGEKKKEAKKSVICEQRYIKAAWQVSGARHEGENKRSERFLFFSAVVFPGAEPSQKVEYGLKMLHWQLRHCAMGQPQHSSAASLQGKQVERGSGSNMLLNKSTAQND